MLNPFPELLNWSFFAPFVLRVILGFYFIAISHKTYKRGRHSQARHPHKDEKTAYGILSAIKFIVGIFLVIGLYTQVTAAVAVAFGIVALWLKAKKSHETPESGWFYILATGVALSLIVLGAGPFAFDLPL